MRSSSRSGPIVVAALAAVLLLVGLTSPALAAATARPAPARSCAATGNGQTGCVSPGARPSVGDCERGGVTCRPDVAGSCTGFSSETTPPATIKVYVPSDSANPIHTVDLRTYVKNVLPNEWDATWDGEALKSGAVAIKSYAWYWTIHFGGYINDDQAQCFDVTDDEDFQVYRAGTATTRTNTVVDEVWPFVARNPDGSVRQALYINYLNNADETCGQYANGTRLSQFGSQACNEASSGNKWNVILQKYYTGLRLATAQQLRTPHDFTYLQTSTRVAFNRGHWVIDDHYPTSFYLGQSPGDIPVVTDAGDGFAHATIFRPSNGTWYLAGPTGAVQSSIQYGLKGDVPVPGHYDGLTQPSTLAVFRPSTGTWYVRGKAPVVLGQQPGDIPVPGDYNGDGTTELAIFRPSNGTWYVAGSPAVQWGLKGDIPVPGDYDGDGKTEVAVFRPSNSTWYLPGRSPVRFGLTGDIPVTGDYNGDGRAEFAVYRPSNNTWYVNGVSTEVFGSAGTTPIGAAPYRG